MSATAARSSATLFVGGAIAGLAAPGRLLPAAGGASYTPAKIQDPCEQRPWRDPESLNRSPSSSPSRRSTGPPVEFGVSRRRWHGHWRLRRRASASPTATGSSDAELARAIRAGLLRAVDDAEEAGALSPFLAGPLRATLRSIPLDQAIELLNDADSLLDNVENFLGPAQGLLEQFLP